MYSVKYDDEGYCKGRREILRHITATEYIAELKMAKKQTATVRKQKLSFLYQQRAFAIERYLDSKEKITILRTEVPEKANLKIEKDIPEFIKVVKNITDSKEYSTISISKKIKASMDK